MVCLGKVVCYILRHFFYVKMMYLKENALFRCLIKNGSYVLIFYMLIFFFESIFISFITGSPDKPRNIEVICDKASAKVQWKSSFNGGDPQSFTIEINGQGETSIYDGIPDTGENKIHTSYVQNLRPSTAYVFYISAQNQHGNSSSTKSTCKTFGIYFFQYMISSN